MRIVTSMFDAPVPAKSALRALRAAGFGPRDVVVVPRLSTADWPSEPGFADLPGDDRYGLVQALRALGLDDDYASGYAEAVQRGAIVVLVRTPTLSAGPAADALGSAGPVDLAEASAKWAAEPELRYGWAETPPPSVDPPTVDLPGVDPPAVDLPTVDPPAIDLPADRD